MGWRKTLRIETNTTWNLFIFLKTTKIKLRCVETVFLKVIWSAFLKFGTYFLYVRLFIIVFVKFFYILLLEIRVHANLACLFCFFFLSLCTLLISNLFLPSLANLVILLLNRIVISPLLKFEPGRAFWKAGLLSYSVFIHCNQLISYKNEKKNDFCGQIQVSKILNCHLSARDSHFLNYFLKWTWGCFGCQVF